MRVISVNRAVSEIKEACQSAHQDGVGSPFWFLVGAGVSHPSVPLASEMIAQCKERVESRGAQLEPEGDSTLDRYSFWLDAAYPQPRQRQRYLEELIQGKKISPAVLRLAHLLLNEDKDVTPLPSLVVTTNFDNHISRALNIFGKHHVISDHPATSVRINPEDNQTVQMVHVHGSYEFYDLANLHGEISEAARSSESHIANMASLLDSILRSRLSCCRRLQRMGGRRGNDRSPPEAQRAGFA